MIKIFAILCILCMSLAVCACKGGDDHTHSFVDGLCACGELDPDFEPEHEHAFVNGVCECGTLDPSILDDLDKPNDPDDKFVTYTVTVVDQNGAPVKDVYIQMCVGDLCKLPQPTDANGVVVFEDFDPADYSVKVNGADGYTFESSYHFAEGSTELTITLTKTAE